ncbi:MAG: hypothetical protein L0214_09970, partial [candidate division NC10 bacterium]|nr:hypothetical protein [candidate division NC10 bacterium]
MSRNTAIGAVVALFLGLILGYFFSSQQRGERIAVLEREVAEVKSKLGMENQELRVKLAETEKKLEQE